MMKPINVVTNNIAREFLSIAGKNSIHISKLYVKINSVKTFYKNGGTTVEIPLNELSKYSTIESLRDNSIAFEQEYNGVVKPCEKGYAFEHMISEIEFKSNDTIAYFVIKKGSKLHYYDGLYDDFLNYILEQKLRSNIMLYLFDTEYKDSIKGLVDVIEQIKTITFKEDKKILVAKGIDAIEAVNSDIHMNIEENNAVGDEDSEGKVDYANRGFLLSCVQGEQLFEFIKPQQGKHGRNCRGKILEVEIINIDAQPTFTVEDGIEVQDSFENIKYLSTKSGYLVKNGNQYDVSNSIDVDEISFKTTGTINSDLDSDISINIIKNNPLEDAVEEGMHVKVQKLTINGSIGPNTIIEARDIIIDGQTHGDSSIKCVNAKIGHHKGKVVARKVEVDALEGGEIIADIAIIKNAMRGKIKAKSIEIEILGSHVIMEASRYIQIEKIKGEENTFILDSLVDSGFDTNKADDQSYIIKTENELKILIQEFKDITIKVKNSLEPCEKIKAAIIKSKNKGIEISPLFIQKFKQCKVLKVHYKKKKERIEHKKEQYDKLKEKLNNSGSNIFDAHITLENALKGYNHIIYKLNNPDREIELHTNDSMNKKIFKLQEDEDGILSIINLN
ncbi:flagellar assembly protein A [Sulfurimonas sp.]|uniref:flagellar assembly protein A n=1 Tax=Sulfurimonas sp. TaxID=2022749 RepID=UPI0025DF3369|nr:flagellar assembly protein A [Sulfurimonas sp.]